MKIYTYLLILIAIMFGMAVQNVNAHAIHNQEAEIVASGYAGSYYNKTTKVLTLRMMVSDGRDRVIIVLSGRGGEVVFKDKNIVDTRGSVVEIPMEDLPEGIYYLRVKGSQIAYATRIRHS